MGASSIVIVALSPYTDGATDRLISMVVGATLATGAAVVARPIGMRVILATAALLCIPVAAGYVHL